MPFTAVDLNLSREAAEPFGEVLLQLGALSVAVEDADAGSPREAAIFGEPGASAGLWAACKLTALFPHEVDAEALVWEAAATCEIETLQFKVSLVDDQDWVRETQAQFPPIAISNRITIVPTWHTAENSANDAINIILDPGAAFGTGSHPTTRMCLEWLEETLPNLAMARVLDYGTGSGILAIAAMKLGAADSCGVDIDPAAVEVAAHNASQNNVPISVASVDDNLQYVADVTIANILANPLKVLAPLLAAHTRPGGQLVLAGLLSEQAGELIDIYAPWFTLSVWRELDGWACLAGARHSA